MRAATAGSDGFPSVALGVELVLSLRPWTGSAETLPAGSALARKLHAGLDDHSMGPTASDDFLDWAARHGARSRDGLGMLVNQALTNARLWTGVDLDGAVMRRVLEDLFGE